MVTAPLWVLLLALLSLPGPLESSRGLQPARTQTPTLTPPPNHGKNETAPLKISNVSRLQRSINPKGGQHATIQFSLSRDAKVTLTVRGPNRELITKVLDGKPCKAGLNTVAWDGRDVDGAIVPDEAYSFDVTAVAADGQSDLWDPLLHTGGERIHVADLRTLDRTRLSYQLPTSARVLVRAAVVNGPLLRTIVNWEPRGAGLCVEHWNGKDADGLRGVAQVRNTRTAVAAMALTDQSIITVGNAAHDYRSYYMANPRRDPKGALHPRTTPRVKKPGTVLSPHWNLPVHLNRDPKLSMTLVGIDDPSRGLKPARTSSQPAPTGKPPGAPPPPTHASTTTDITTLLTTPVLVRIDIPDALQREFMNDQRFEVILYVDDRRLLEVEQGFVPFTYPWDISTLAAGQHVLTINVSSYRNHVGTVSRLVSIQR